MKPDYIYWFAFFNTYSPSVRYRATYALEFIKKNHGIRYQIVYPGYHPKKIGRFLSAYLSALFFRRKNSMIVIQRVHSDFIYANLLKFLLLFRKKNTVYDLDDADYLEHPPKNIFKFCKRCEKLIVSSNELVKNLSPYNSKIILNTSPVPDLNIVKKNRNGILNIGWIGCFSGDHKKTMMGIFFPALTDLPFTVKLTVLGVETEKTKKEIENYFKASSNISLEIPMNIDWYDEEGIQNRIAQFDIGIATLTDTELQRSKSAFKLKQYLNNGVPVLSSDLPENNFFVKNGWNGFLCKNTEEFKLRIMEIQKMDDAKYGLLSVNARKSVIEFDLRHYSEVLIGAFNSR